MAGKSNAKFAQNSSEPTALITMPEGASAKLVDLTFMTDGAVPGCLLIDWKGGPLGWYIQEGSRLLMI